jgi:hypothetical protein
MTKRRPPVSFSTVTWGLAALFCMASLGAPPALANQDPAPQGEPPASEEPTQGGEPAQIGEPYTEETPAPASPVMPAPPAPAVSAPVVLTDHDQVVGAWGVEARRIATLQRTLGQELGCEMACPVDLNALSLRRWASRDYAWSLGLALGLGGGSSRRGGRTATWDTYLGVGPTVSAAFLLANWKHLAVSFGPQIDLLYFMPSGRGSKTFLANVRGVFEGEVHLGMLGLPSASVAVTSGLQATVLYATRDRKAMPIEGATALKWELGLTGPTSLWDLVTLTSLRYYF